MDATTLVDTTTRDALRRIGSMPSIVIGARLKRARIRTRMSIRDLASEAKISKNSVLRLEQGLGTHLSTIQKVCSALRLPLADLADMDDLQSEEPAVHLAQNDEWVDLADQFGKTLGSGGPLSPRQRRALVRQGVSCPLLILKSRLAEGLIRPSVLELYEATLTRAHSGEEFVYVLEGRVRLVIGGREYDLGTGDSITFWSSEPHRYEPLEEGEPARLLVVQSIESDMVALF